MSTATAEKITLKLNRFIKAPQQRVFEAWTQPELIMKWFGPGTSYLKSAKVDARVGGKYSLHMKTDGCGTSKEPGESTVGGTYREVKPYSRLAFTWGWGDDADDTLVTVDFVAVQGGTQVTLTHEGFPSEESRNNHNFGWTGALDKLERQSANMAACMAPGNFSWNELIAADTDKQGAFYTKLFGWEATPKPGGMPYTIFKMGNEYVGGMMKCPQEGLPSHWLPYITVKNTDESLAEAVKLGAKIAVPAMDIPDVGRIGVLIDPNGAAFGLFQPGVM